MTRRSKIAVSGVSVTLGLCLGALLVRAVPGLRSPGDSRYAGRATGSARAEGGIASRTVLPQLVFWAWERPEDFRFLAPGQAAVAFLAKTIYLESSAKDGGESGRGKFTVRPRLQPLRVAPGTPLIAVVRIEIRGPSAPREGLPQKHAVGSNSSADSRPLRQDLASEIVALPSLPGVAAVQIDFDAPASAHAFYAGLLQEVRRQLPQGMQLSITALASWCIGDPWLKQLPPGTIDEAVPMLFRMGRDGEQVVIFMRQDQEFPVLACRQSLGLSIDEEFSEAVLKGIMASQAMELAGKRVYVFAPHAWTAEDAREILKEMQP